MGNYVQSIGIDIFPTSLRDGDYSHGKFTSEENLTNFLKSVTDVNSFVIAGPYSSEISQDNPHFCADAYKFVINGFYFEVGKQYIDGLGISGEELWAAIKLDTANRLISWDGRSLDQDGECKAVYFSATAPEAAENCRLNLKAADKFAKFTTDTFVWHGMSLDDVIESKQDKFTELNPFNLSAGLVSGVLPVANGGTGHKTLVDTTEEKGIVVQSSRGLVDDEDKNVNKGSATGTTSGGVPVYFVNGVPREVSVVDKAYKLTKLTGEAINTASNRPVHFKNGIPTPLDEDGLVDAFVRGVQNPAGKLDTSSSTMEYTSVYFNGTNNRCEALEGITMFISNTESPDASKGKKGDLWFIYE